MIVTTIISSFTVTIDRKKSALLPDQEIVIDSPRYKVSYSLKDKYVIVSGRLIVPVNLLREVFTATVTGSKFDVIRTTSAPSILPKETYLG